MYANLVNGLEGWCDLLIKAHGRVNPIYVYSPDAIGHNEDAEGIVEDADLKLVEVCQGTITKPITEQVVADTMD